MKAHFTTIIRVGNSQGIRLPKEYVAALGSKNVILEQKEEGILIKPVASKIPPLKDWAALFAQVDTSPEAEFADWDITLKDGIEDEEGI
jgi:antitoxin MazE